MCKVGAIVGESLDDERLIACARSGDCAAFAALVAHYQQPLGGYLTRLTGDREVSLDLAQETFIRAYKALNRLPADRPLRPWLYRIATNLACDHCRRQRLLRWLPLSVLEHRLGDDNTSLLVEREIVRQVLSQLKAEECAVLLLCGMEQQSYPQAALVLGCSVEAIRKRFQRAKARFRAAYVQIDPGGAP